MNPNAKFQHRNLRVGTATRIRAALATVAVLLVLGAPLLAAAQGAQGVIAPTGPVPMGSTIPVQWNPSFSSSPTVSIHLAGYGGTPVTLAANVSNNGHASVNLPLPPELPCEDGNRLYHIMVSPGSVGFAASGWSAQFKLACGSGSLTVVKTVINDSGRPIANGAFSVDVACGPNGPNTTLALSSANGFQSSVTGLHPGRTCTINEQAPKAPAGCRWTTTYPLGKGVDIGGSGNRLEIHNRLNCQSVGNTSIRLPVRVESARARVSSAGATGSLTVRKQVVNGGTGVPPPSGPFLVQVTCSMGGPNVQVSLSSANTLTQVVGTIPANSVCTIAEQAPPVPPELTRRGCGWQTRYPDGQNATMPSPATTLSLTVVNRWNCK